MTVSSRKQASRRKARRARPRNSEPAGPEPGKAWFGPSPPISRPHAPALLAGILCGVFQELGVGASVMDGMTWYALHRTSDITVFEGAHDLLEPRWAYNERLFSQARRDGKPVRGEHAGFCDWFAPIRGGRWALSVGPFAVGRPSAGEIAARWHDLTGAQARVSDPEFLHYLEVTLSTTTFEGAALAALEQLVGCVADLLGSERASAAQTRQVESLRERLSHVRDIERMWHAVREITDERTWRGWDHPGNARNLWLLGCRRPPKHVLVGLLLGTDVNADPVDDLVRRDALVRAVTEFAFERRGMLSGRLGSQAVVTLVDAPRSGARLRTQIDGLAEQIRRIARRLGLSVHFGSSAAGDSDPPVAYQAALAAAEAAISTGRGLVRASPGAPRKSSALGELRRRMAADVRENPSLLGVRFDRFVEVASLQSGHRLEPMRAHLESAFESVADAFRVTNALDARSLQESQDALSKASADATGTADLVAAYRTALSDIAQAVLHPPRARNERRVRRAVTYVSEHYAEPLTVARVARAVGLAPRYFSKVFKATEHVTFHRYLSGVRIERAKRMLLSTPLSVERVGQLAGFPDRTHFHRAFKRALGISPVEFRRTQRALHPSRRGRRETDR